MKKITVSILTTLLMLSMVFSSSVFAAEKEQSAWDSFLGLFSAKTAATSDVGVEYRGHIQNIGNYPLDGTWIQGPTELGTEGKSLRLEGFWIRLNGEVPAGAHIEYQVHVQNVGWMDPVQDGAFAGTEGKSQQIEAIKISLVDDEGVQLKDYSVVYTGHVQNKGDVGPYTNGEQLGTDGEFLRLEAITVEIVQNPADLDAYEAALAAVKQADYTAASWTTYQAVVNANKMTEDNLQSEVDAATANITAAQANLVKVLKVDSVSASNLKEINVVFNNTVDKTTAETAANYVLSNGALGAVTPVLQADNKTVILTVATAAAQQATTDVTVKNVKDTNGTVVVETKKTVTFFDTVAPTVSKVEVTGPKALRVTFSEPIKSVPTFLLNSGSYSVTPTFVAGSKTIDLTLGATLPNGTQSLEVSGGQDYANFGVVKATTTFEYATDTTAPTATVSKATETVVTLKFDKLVKITGVNGTDVTAYHSINNAATYKGTLAAVSADSNGYSDTYTATFTAPIPAGTGKVMYLNTTANKFEDKWGNDVASASYTFDVITDTTTPAVTLIEATGTNGTAQKELTVTFNKEVVQADAQNKANYVLKDASGNVVTTTAFADVDTNGKFNANATLAYTNTNKQVKISFTNVLKAGDYKLEVSNIKDTTYAANKMTTQTVAFTVADKIAPTVGATTYSSGTNHVLYVSFSEAMNAADITNPANYAVSIGGVSKSLPTGSTVEIVNSQQAKVTILGTATYPVATNVVTVQVAGTVKDLAGNAIGGVVGNSTNTVTWGTASTYAITPAAKQVKLIAKNQLQLELNRELSAIDVTKFTVTNADGLTVAGATYVNNSGKSLVTVTLSGDLTTTDLTRITNLVIADGGVTTSEGLVLSGGPATFTVAGTHFEDKLAPAIKAVETTDTTHMTLRFTENLKAGDVSNLTFGVAGNTVTAIDNTTANVVVLTLGTAIGTGDVPVVTQLLNIRDTNDNVLAAGTAVIATSDKIAPVVVGTPAITETTAGHWGQTLGDKVVITFSEAIKPSTLNIAGIAANGDTSAAIASPTANVFAAGKLGVFATPAAGANIATVETTVNLDSTGTIVTITVTKVGAAVDSPAGAFTRGAGITDLAGN
ncbi:hypothetical protein FXB42_07820 [Acetobacterium wieringae]|uniref:Clostridial hydrophobic W n=1 Tax=Acetobacterium wieringae TaxID=52694 RepID=A0A5D0WNU2_9FIRM|nr:hypothetical protein [Acetobacterium wieringae]TYC85774.1 hypothetical protein FXB42_07820 [Acetobacterium wieringae]